MHRIVLPWNNFQIHILGLKQIQAIVKSQNNSKPKEKDDNDAEISGEGVDPNKYNSFYDMEEGGFFLSLQDEANDKRLSISM